LGGHAQLDCGDEERRGDVSMAANSVRFVDTTFRDGSQSLWAMGMRGGMMAAVAADLDRAGLDVIEVPGNSINFKKLIRDLKENPWDLMRRLAQKMPRTPKSCMGGGLNLNPLGTPTPPELGKLFWTLQADIGALNRVQLTSNTADQIERMFPTLIPFFQGIGLKTACALSFSISPRHTDEHYAEKTRALLPLKPDVIYLKDQGGLLTVDRLRTIIPVISKNAGNVPIELHSHCTTGLAPSVYMEALKLGVMTLHTGVPPLADGSAQPSVISTVKNARLLGYSSNLDDELLSSISDRLTTFAIRDDMPIGRPLPYDFFQYIHQIPGGVISNLRFQLSELRLEHRLNEVIAECVTIHRELGYPVMITPFSQYVATQATMNVVTGERYKVVIDEIIRLARGFYGEDSGYQSMDQDLKDRLLNSSRARELAAIDIRAQQPMSLKELRESLAGPGVSDEELLMRVVMQGTSEIDAMRASGAPRQYFSSSTPLVTLLEELTRHRGVRSVHIRRGRDSISLQNRSIN
jgi:oxaloacetate decarboxylase (Na+ extruding) subunit alpha